MLPSRGLRPTHITPLASRQSAAIRSNASRKFSSLPRTAGLSAPSRRTGSLQSSGWRAGATSNSHIALNASSVRYGSWYAPWSWGKSSTGTETVAVGEFSSQHPQPTAVASEAAATPSGPAVTTATPELQPGSIDQTSAVAENTINTPVQGSETVDAQLLDELLAAEPIPDKANIDPTQLIDHAGHLKELGLDYGWGMTTTFEKLIETMYLQSGWGWAGSIMATTLVVRCGLFVFQALSSHNMASMAAMKPITAPIQAKLDAAIARGDDEQVQLLKMQQAQVMKPFIGSSLSTFGFMGVQMWIGISAFRFLRAMGEMPVPGMSKDGLLWFTDLTMHDPYYFLPAATSGVMWFIFKKGGETGVQNEVGQAGMTGARSGIMGALALGMGVFTCWQPAGLQLYFLTSAFLGGITGFLLRQPGFRRFIGIRMLPTPESNAVFDKVARGELKLKDIKGPDGKIRYQAPRAAPSSSVTSSGSSSTRGINIKAGAAMPLHMRSAEPVVESGPRDRDPDFEEGAKGTLSEKLNYYRRNYRLSYIQRRFKNGTIKMMRRAGYKVDNEGSPEQERRKRRAEQWELERRRRFENARK